MEGGLRGNEGRQACSSRGAQSSWAAGMRMQNLCSYLGRQSFSSSYCVLEEPQSAAQAGRLAYALAHVGQAGQKQKVLRGQRRQVLQAAGNIVRCRCPLIKVTACNRQPMT